MFITLLKINESDKWSTFECPHKESIKEIWAVYVYDPNWRVHLCEFTPSYELHFIETQVEFHDGVSDEDMERIENWIMDAYSEPITYMHCHTVNTVIYFKEGWFPSMSMGSVRMSGFGKEFKFDPNDRAERPIREQRHDYALLEAIEYCQQNGV